MMGICEKIEKKNLLRQRKLLKDAFKGARTIAEILKKRFGASEVILYGSIIRKNAFNNNSDIDLAVKGLEENYYRAFGYCIRNSEFELDIKIYEDMPDEYKKIVDKTGYKLL